MGETELRRKALAMGGALGLSLCVHTLLVAALVWASQRTSPPSADPHPREDPDIWRGRTLDVDTVLAPATQNEPLRASEPSTALGASLASPADPRAAGSPEPVFEPPEPPKAQGAAVASSADQRQRDADAEGQARQFGAEGLEGPARQFAKAFARALPPAIRSDPSWQTAPSELELEFSLEAFFGPDGRVARLETTPSRLPQRVERLCQKTLLFLGIGRFAHSEKSAGNGSQSLFFAMELGDEPASEDLPRIAYQPPTASKPGYAVYTFESGRNVKLWIALEAQVLQRRPR